MAILQVEMVVVPSVLVKNSGAAIILILNVIGVNLLKKVDAMRIWRIQIITVMSMTILWCVAIMIPKYGEQEQGKHPVVAK